MDAGKRRRPEEVLHADLDVTETGFSELLFELTISFHVRAMEGIFDVGE